MARTKAKAGARASSAPGGETLVALMRGINVGGKNRLAMTDLAAAFEAEGCSDVRTYIQSGNVVFRAPKGRAAGLAAALAKRILRVHGVTTPVVLRTARELAAVARANPYLARKADEDALHVMFLADEPARAAVAGLDAKRSPPDEFVLRGRELYLCCPNGMARTKLTNAYFDSKLETVSTVRNWRTVLKLVEMSGGATAS